MYSAITGKKETNTCIIRKGMTCYFLHPAISVNDVDDVRPVLDYYKSQGGGNVLETFKANRERLKAEEEMERERIASQRGSSYRLGGAIPTFKFGGLSRHAQSTELPAEHTSTQVSVIRI